MLIMGSGNTKNGLQKDDKIAVDRVKPRQQEEQDHDNLVNKPSNNQEKNKNLLNNNEPIPKETKENEDKKSIDSDDEDSQVAQDVKLKLAEKGFSDPTLISHCEKTPKYLNYFTSIYEAIKIIEEKIKDEDVLSIQRQATVISSSYSKVKRKTILGNFLAEMGFANIFKEIFLKLDSGFPDLFTYDRELGESLKKPSAVENESNRINGTKEVKKDDEEATESSDHQKPKESSNSTSTTKTGNNLEISSDQTLETGATSVKLNLELTEASVTNATSSNQVIESSDTSGKPNNVPSVEASSVIAAEATAYEQPKEGLNDVQPNVQPSKDGVEHANASTQPTESNSEPINAKPEKPDDTEASSNKPADSNQSEKVNVAEKTDKPTVVEEKKAKPSNPLLKAQDLLSKIMLSAINYTDACDNMNLAFSEEGVVQLLVNAVAKLKDCTGHHVKYMNEEGGLKKRTIRGGILTKVLGTLHNLSKRVPTRHNFHACDAVKIILPLIDDEVNRFAIDALLIIAYLIDEENNDLIMANEGPIKYLISMISKATNKSIHRYLGYTNSELAQGLAQIAINDSNKKQIVGCGAIPVLTHMIEAAKIENEKVTAAEALWMLAFDQKNREEMKKNEKCMALLNEMKESKNDKTKKAASGALWEIEGKQNVKTGSLSDGKASANTTNHVMISYQWDVQKTLIQVKDRLQAAGFRVWMDLEQMGGSTLEAMANAVENSAVVLVCVSQKYKESSNCRSEAEYAFQLKKDIVPLMMDRNYRPDGWLGMIMGSKLWIDFTLPHISKVESSVKDLIRELGVRGKGDSEIVPVRSVDVVDAKPTIDISGWTNVDVLNWMKGFGLVVQNKRAVETLTGPILMRLHAFRNEVSPEFYYSSLKEDFGFPRMIDVLIFSDELKKLLS